MILRFKTKLECVFSYYGSAPILIYLNFDDQAGKKEENGMDINDEVSFCRLHQHIEALQWGVLLILCLNQNRFSRLKIYIGTQCHLGHGWFFRMNEVSKVLCFILLTMIRQTGLLLVLFLLLFANNQNGTTRSCFT